MTKKRIGWGLVAALLIAAFLAGCSNTTSPSPENPAVTWLRNAGISGLFHSKMQYSFNTSADSWTDGFEVNLAKRTYFHGYGDSGKSAWAGTIVDFIEHDGTTADPNIVFVKITETDGSWSVEKGKYFAVAFTTLGSYINASSAYKSEGMNGGADTLPKAKEEFTMANGYYTTSVLSSAQYYPFPDIKYADLTAFQGIWEDDNAAGFILKIAGINVGFGYDGNSNGKIVSPTDTDDEVLTFGQITGYTSTAGATGVLYVWNQMSDDYGTSGYLVLAWKKNGNKISWDLRDDGSGDAWDNLAEAKAAYPNASKVTDWTTFGDFIKK